MTDPVDLQAEFTKALEELRDLCDDDVPVEERKIRLAVRKELNKLLGLYCRTLLQDSDAVADIESVELAEVREHLEPLNLAPEGTPVGELARLAAMKITQL